MVDMTPGQIAAVEESLVSVDLDAHGRLLPACVRRGSSLVGDVHERSRRAAGALRGGVDEIVHSMRSMDEFEPEVRALGARHRTYGVRAAHYRLMGRALLGALAAALGPQWTPDVSEAWSLAYNLTAETMQLGAMERAH